MKFRCKQSKTVVEFTTEWDIEQMKKHPEYDIVEEVSEEAPKASEKPTKKSS